MKNKPWARTREWLLTILSPRQINFLRRIKWFVLSFATNDRLTIKKFIEKEIELHILEKLIRREDVVVDVGANIGCYSFYLAQFVSPKGKVISFEPRSDINDRLRMQLKAFPHCRVERLGLSSSAKMADLHLPTSHGRSSLVKYAEFAGFRSEKIQLVKLDDYAEKYGFGGSPSFIKIDVEGHEFEVIHGAEKLLRSCKPLILCESEDRHLHVQGKSVAMFLEVMTGHGYDGYVIDEFRIVPAAQIRESGKLFNNFWFVHRDDAESLVRFRDAINTLRIEQK